MNKEDIKVRLVEIFAYHKDKDLIIDDTIIEKYRTLLWPSVLNSVVDAIKNRADTIHISKWSISTWDLIDDKVYSINVERENIYKVMFPIIGKWFDELNIKYTAINTASPAHSEYEVLVNDLKKFSNAENLSVLL
jgi:hypothetical protein